jgi:hypothetical protein
MKMWYFDSWPSSGGSVGSKMRNRRREDDGMDVVCDFCFGEDAVLGKIFG